MFRSTIGIVVITGIIGAWMSCLSPRDLRVEKAFRTEIPPNGVYIDNDFFCDQSEISNMSWLEYMHWNARVFGKSSAEYVACLPDTNVWRLVGDSVGIYRDYYLRHVAYHDFPVVGISQEQANNFSKWRSDRVFELILIRDGYIISTTHQTRDNYFSIESYYNGSFSGIAEGPRKMMYPKFRLPSKEEWIRIDQFADSVYLKRVEECKSMSCRECLSRSSTVCGVKAFARGEAIAWPTASVHETCWKGDEETILHIRGNVREWLDEPGLAAGWGWNDPGELVAGSEFAVTNGVDAWTGFRNVCEWMVYE